MKIIGELKLGKLPAPVQCMLNTKHVQRVKLFEASQHLRVVVWSEQTVRMTDEPQQAD